MACVSYCDTSLLEHDLVICNEYKLGGVSAIIVGACGTELIDPSDAVEVDALLVSGEARLISDIRFALPAGSPITVDSPIGCGTSIRINEDRTATLYDANVTDGNNTFWNDVNNRRISWILAYMCDSGKVIYITAPVGITTSANFILPEQNNELQRYEVTFSWRNKNIPEQYNAPAGVFA
jgi:hypothetical protein